MRTITKIRRSVRAISPVIATLLMIAIAVVASIVAYAWVMGYMGRTTNKIGNAILIQSIGQDANGNMVVYVQNVGQGSVTFDPKGSVYVNSELLSLTSADFEEKTTLNPRETATIHTGVAWAENLKVKIVTTDGTSAEGTTKYSGSVSPTYGIDVTVAPVGGGSVSADKVAPYHLGDVVTLTEVANPGYTFSGWSGDGMDSSGSRVVNVTGNMAVSAAYTANVYTLTKTVIPSSDAGTVSADVPPPYHYNDVVTLTETPAPGYAFSGWSVDGTGTGTTCGVTMNGDKAVTASFVQIQYSIGVSIVPTGGGSVTPDKVAPYHYGDVVTLTEVANPGYTFSGWSGAGIGSGATRQVTVTGNMAVTASFTQNVYTLTVNLSPSAGGSVGKNPDQATYHYGDSVQLTATENPGYVFSGWSGDASGVANPTSITINSNKQVTASFVQSIYSVDVTVSPTGGGSVSADKVAPYHLGDVVTLTEVANPGYTFSGWSGAGIGSGATRQVTVTGNMAVTASFTQNVYTLTVNLSPSAGGSVAKNPSQATYHYGDTVQLTATQNIGWTFSGWSGDLSSTSNTASVTIDGNKVVTASFVQIQYSIGVTIVPTGGGSVTPDKVAPYHYGDVVTLTESANLGYTFSGWSGDGVDSSGSRVVTVTGNMAVTASFNQNEYTLTVNRVGSGSVSNNPSQATYHYGDSVQLTATENPGWTFSAWSGDLASVANPASITIDGNKIVTATFIQNFEPFGLDGSNSTNVVSGNKMTISLTNAHPNDVLYLSFVGDSGVTITGITSSGASAWTQRADLTYSGTHHLETYYAIRSDSGPTTITVSLSGGGSCAAVAYGISGADTSSPFDVNYRTTTGTGAGAGVTITTSNANDFIIGVLGVDYSYGGSADTAFVPTTPFNVIAYQKAVSSRMVMDEFHTYNTVQNNLNVGCAWNSNYGGPWRIIAEAIKRAYNPSPFGLDGSNSTNVVSGNKMTISLTNAHPNDVLYLSFVGDSGVTITGITSSGASAWTQRADLTYSGTHHLETYYAIRSDSGPTTITVSLSGGGSCAAVAYGISGADISSPFDGNARTNIGYANPPGSTFTTVSITTSNANDFIIGAAGVENAGAATGLVPRTNGFIMFKYQAAGSSPGRLTADEYLEVNTIQAGLNVGFSWNSNYGGYWGMIADAINKAPYT